MPGEPNVAPDMRLALLLATRLCHDLSGPLSGLGAALGEMPQDPEALQLAIDAARALRLRVALLRAAWSTDPPAIARDGLRDLSGGLTNAARLRMDLDELEDSAAFDPVAARLLVNVMLLAAESLPAGGVITLGGSPGGPVFVRIAGKRAAWPVGLGAMLASAAAARQAADALHGSASVSGLQAPLTALLIHAADVPAALLLAATAEQAPPLLLDFAVHTQLRPPP
jgi:histidine phosphotransferase ChpT